MNAVGQSDLGSEKVVRKLRLAYDLLSECARTDHPAIRRGSRKARAALGPVLLALGIGRTTSRNEEKLQQGLFMDG